MNHNLFKPKTLEEGRHVVVSTHNRNCNEYIEIQCKVCNKLFKHSKKHYEKRNGRVFYCCRACYYIGQRGKHYTIYKCINCGKEFKGYPSGTKRGGNKFCSLSCASSGKFNKNWKGGNVPIWLAIRNHDETKKWRDDCFKRDNYTCQLCGQYGGRLEVHHIKKFSSIVSEFLKFYSQFSPIEDKFTLVRLSLSYPEFWDLNNGITYCDKCHMKLDQDRNRRRGKNAA